MLRDKLLIDQWRRELTGANDDRRREWRNYWAWRALLTLIAGLVFIGVGTMLANLHPAFLLLTIPGFVVLWRAARIHTLAHRVDPFPPPSVDA
jgi:hypothetical protein